MRALLVHSLFVIAVLGTKVILALWIIYYLFPGDRCCPRCDAETLPLQMTRSQRLWGALLFLGKVRSRWCPECCWEGFSRRVPGTLPVLPPSPVEHHAGRPR
ncbi:MAG TPA: hypothetical protein VIC59_04765 [Gemmatimonadota bacterium]|jgi:hypothetical protein